MVPTASLFRCEDGECLSVLTPASLVLIGDFYWSYLLVLSGSGRFSNTPPVVRGKFEFTIRLINNFVLDFWCGIPGVPEGILMKLHSRPGCLLYHWKVFWRKVFSKMSLRCSRRWSETRQSPLKVTILHPYQSDQYFRSYLKFLCSKNMKNFWKLKGMYNRVAMKIFRLSDAGT